MPGLVGIISKQQPENCERIVRTMLASMQYEEFYKSGLYSNADMSAYVGWTSHPNSFCDCLPVTNQPKDIILFFSGEVFYDQHQRTAGEIEGGANNAKRLIRLYEKDGEKFFEKLNGWFCGLLLDIRRGKAFLFNDRYGMHRVFVHEGKEGLYFASKAKALLTVLPETRYFDSMGLAEFFTCGCTLGIRSLYRGIKVLPSASLWTVAKGAVNKKSIYFDRADWECQERLNASRFAQNVIEIFPAVVRKYGKDRRHVGISLTGGFDSRMLMACLEMSPGEFPCYTFGSMYRDTFDVSVARQVAKKCEQNHTVLVLGQNFLRDFPRYMEQAVSRSDGYIGLSGAAELYVNSLARDIAPVRLTGNYGSELLRGVCAFKSIMPKAGFLTPDFQMYLRDAQQKFAELKATNPISFTLFHQAPCQGYGRLAIEESQVIMRTPFMDNGLAMLIYQRPYRYAAGTDLSVYIIMQHRPDLLKIPTDRGELGSGSSLMKKIRFGYHEVLFKGEYWASHGMPHWVSNLNSLVPWLFPIDGLIGRHKFQHFRTWVQKELSNFVWTVLDTDNRTKLDKYIDFKRVKEMLAEQQDGKRNFMDEIDKLMTIVLANRLFLRNK